MKSKCTTGKNACATYVVQALLPVLSLNRMSANQ
jgi:hypothetical protein